MLAHSPGWISLLMGTAVYLSGFWMREESRAGCCSLQAAAKSGGNRTAALGSGLPSNRHQLGFFVLWHMTLLILLQSFLGVLGISEGTFLPCAPPQLQVSPLEAWTVLLFLLLVIPLLATICRLNVATSGYTWKSWK